ncbi:MAG: GIY-YIG nuclease family protein [Chthoniobacterales bacterium]
MKTYYVYMMTNRSRVVLYIGLTNSLATRVWQHRHSDVKGFTKRYKVDRLVYHESFERVGDAISRETEIKAWRRSKKNALVETKNPRWADLSAALYQPERGPSSSPRLGMTTGKRAAIPTKIAP